MHFNRYTNKLWDLNYILTSIETLKRSVEIIKRQSTYEPNLQRWNDRASDNEEIKIESQQNAAIKGIPKSR